MRRVYPPGQGAAASRRRLSPNAVGSPRVRGVCVRTPQPAPGGPQPAPDDSRRPRALAPLPWLRKHGAHAALRGSIALAIRGGVDMVTVAVRRDGVLSGSAGHSREDAGPLHTQFTWQWLGWQPVAAARQSCTRAPQHTRHLHGLCVLTTVKICPVVWTCLRHELVRVTHAVHNHAVKYDVSVLLTGRASSSRRLLNACRRP